MQTNIEWQSRIQFYTKSTTQKLAEISRDFDFTIDPSVLSDHEELGSLRWTLQERLGKDNYRATKALTKLYFTYLNYGRDLLSNERLISQIIDELVHKFRHASSITKPDNYCPSRTRLVLMDAGTINPLMSEYHFLGYGRTDSYHLGVCCDDSEDGLIAAATFSPWDLDHATPILEQFAIKPTEVLVLSRLLSVPGTQRLTLSQFIAQLNVWIRKKMREIKMIVTYCNPNAGHYGTVYRGANFRPLCTETHSFIPFSHDDYVSPRKCKELYDLYGPSGCRSLLRPGAIRPLPLLIYYYPLRLTAEERQRISVGHCVHPYPLEFDASVSERLDESNR
jgi:hypothetical protein